MTSVKTIYPEFKCLTTFRKVMKRIESAKGIGYYLICKLKITDYERNGKLCDRLYAMREQGRTTMFYRHFENLLNEDEIELDKMEEEYTEQKVREGGSMWLGSEDWDNIRQKMSVKFPMFYKFIHSKYQGDIWIEYVDKKYPQKWLWNEQNKYEMMAKKWEFQQAMISRDYKAITLCDDVIGLINEYL
jgi:hypothetical protein